jgi:hypothetical protein
MRLWIVGKLWGAREGALFLCSILVFADAACSALTTNSLEYGLHPRLKPSFEAKTANLLPLREDRIGWPFKI